MGTKWKTSKCAVSLLCFVTGIMLLVFSGFLALRGLSLGCWRDAADAWKRDYQDTAAFQALMEYKLEHYIKDTVTQDDTTMPDSSNLLYVVQKNGRTIASNTDRLAPNAPLPEGFNFRLYFDQTQVTIEKDGQVLDIYGDGCYHPEKGDWHVPGYRNLSIALYAPQAGAGITVCLAAAENPVYWEGTYDPLYALVQDCRQTRTVVLTLSLIPVTGLILLIVYLILRRDKARADRAIAWLTGHIWLEIKLLLLIPLGYLTIGASLLCFHFVFYGMERPVSIYWSVPAALWLIYLYCNDLRYNGRRCLTHSLCAACGRLLRTEELHYPVQRRIARRAIRQFICAIPFIAGSALLALILLGSCAHSRAFRVVFLLLCLAGLALIAIQIFFLRQSKAAATDLGALLERIEVVHAGKLNSAPLLSADSDLRHAAESLEDIESGLQTALEEHIRSERMKVELITNVSHDLKTPLTSIVSYAELICQEKQLPSHVQEYAQILSQKALRLRDMVQEVFEVSKAASGNLPVQLRQLDLSKLLRQTLADMAEAIDASTLSFRVQLPDLPVLIQADGDRLYRVFQNLIQNALQYSMAASRVYLTLKSTEGHAQVQVQNISRDELTEGVDFTARFVRGDKNRTDGGSGLGLSIARTFTEACGGTFQVQTAADLFIVTVTFAITCGAPETEPLLAAEPPETTEFEKELRRS